MATTNRLLLVAINASMLMPDGSLASRDVPAAVPFVRQMLPAKSSAYKMGSAIDVNRIGVRLGNGELLANTENEVYEKLRRTEAVRYAGALHS